MDPRREVPSGVHECHNEAIWRVIASRRMRSLVVVCAFLGGCYMEGGLGAAAPGQATLHGSMGFIGHFGETASVHAGAGGGLYPSTRAPRPDRSRRKPVVVGAEATILASGQSSLVATADLQPPFMGQLHTPDYDSSEKATTMRPTSVSATTTCGRRSLVASRTARRSPRSPTALGPELWYTGSDVHASSTKLGGAFSLVLEDPRDAHRRDVRVLRLEARLRLTSRLASDFRGELVEARSIVGMRRLHADLLRRAAPS